MHIRLSCLAGGRGFEPRHTDPESAVLPLDEPPESSGRYFTMNARERQTVSHDGEKDNISQGQ